MAEVILSPVANLIIETLSSAAVKKIGELYSLKDDLEELEGTLSTIRAVLLDAERQQSHNNQVRLWLQRLEDVMSDADDLVDEVATEGLRRQLMPQRNIVLKTLRIFFSSSNQLVVRSRLAGEISRVRKRLAAISADRRDFKLEESRVEIARPVRIARETHSFVVEENVFGREEDKRRVLELLLEKNEVEEERVRVVSIFGMGGLGKTTLAKLVFNDKSVEKDFELKSWVCVSDNFEEKVILGLIVKSLDGTTTRNDDCLMEEMIKIVREKMSGKRYLLVLDDVWNENHQKWEDLMGILTHCGVSGSRIIVTTRSERVAKLASNVVQPFRLGVIRDKDSWCLFEKIAFQRRSVEEDAMEVGKEILKKCGGVPLAIRMIASMLSFKDPKTEWPSFLKKELSSLPQQQNDILPTLKLSYDSLPSHLKHCFAFCSLFPKNHFIKVETLMNLWVAQGFISISSDRSLEDTGYDYFMELLWRCFLQDGRNVQNKVIWCKKHDLVHDLAVQVAGDKYAIIDPSSQQNTFKKVQYVSLGHYVEGSLTSLKQAKRLRTMFWLGYYHYFYYYSLEDFKFLRMLDMHGSYLETVPDSIGNLKHLRYLDLSHNDIVRLPKSITKLVNLQTLKLNTCPKLRELPSDVFKLVNLRHLEFKCSWSDYKLYLPRRVSQMNNLQDVSYFEFSSDVVVASRSCKLEDLTGLKNLTRIKFKGLRSGMETNAAKLKEKEHLQNVSLEWSTSSDDQDQEKTLEGLEPHPNLIKINFNMYGGVKFCDWLSSLTNLVKVKLEKCSKLKQLPSLDSLHSLRIMRLYHCDALEYIVTYFNNDISTSTTKSGSVFPSLQKLVLMSLSNFIGWQNPNVTKNTHQLSYFPSLIDLYIDSCPKLTSMPLYPNVKNLKLTCSNGKPFLKTLSMNVDSASTSSLKSASFDRLSTVKTLHLSCCSGSDVRYLPSWMRGLSSLKTLEISEHKGSEAEFQVMDYNMSTLKWMVKERDDWELHVETSHVTWEIFSRIRELTFKGAPILKYISIGAQFLNSLEKVVIKEDNEVELSSYGCDTIKWEALTSLQSIFFIKLPNLVALPEWIQNITTLKKLEVWDCDSLTTFPDSISKLSSLRALDIWRCPKMESLPESITGLTSLKRLYFTGCPGLSKRYAKKWGNEAHQYSSSPIFSTSVFEGKAT